MSYRKAIVFFLAAFFGFIRLQAQLNEFRPEMSRSLFHSRLDKAQQDLMAMDGRADSALLVFQQPDMDQQLTFLAGRRIDDWQRRVENNTAYDHNRKITWLRGMTELLYDYIVELRSKSVQWSDLGALLDAFEASMAAADLGSSLAEVVNPLPYPLAKMISSNFAFSNVPGAKALEQAVFLKYIRLNPRQTLRKLAEKDDYPFTDSLLSAVARKRPEELMAFAQARNTPLARRIAAHPDSLVRMIAALSEDQSGQLYFPFIDQMSKGVLTRGDIDAALKDSSAYYRLLVKTQVEYAGRMAAGDTPVVTKSLQEMLHWRSLELYVNTINGLHDLPAPVRFKKIQPLGIQELYYLIVLNEAEIYTSSYIYVYKRMFELMPRKNADSLLQLVNFDRYKKFLTMAANYNTLNDFLSFMSPQKSVELMTSFVNDLDRGRNTEDIEDAVDVANAYGSITSRSIRQLMLKQVNHNLAQAQASLNQKGVTIYRIEKVLMESSDSQLDSTMAAVNISDSLGIPPVYEVSNTRLRDSLGRIVLQMYFYGDVSGKGTFNHLMRLYSDRTKWAQTATPDWVMFKSIGTKVPFVLLANRALDEENDEDENAQLRLIDWMNENGYAPAITVHRGHSYYLPYTIKKMLPSKVVVLGSCGAYHNLADVLKISPDASIISSKQVGYGEINVALFSYLVDRLKNGLDVQWPAMMSSVATRISTEKKEGFDDYVFPHQNLGAMFIKAYKNALAAAPASDVFSFN